LTGLTLFVVSGIVVTGPMLPFFIAHREALMARTNEVFLFSPANMTHSLGKYHVTSATQVVIEQLWRALLTFNYTPDSSTQFGFRHSLLNPRLAPMLVLGVGFCLGRLARLSRFVVAMWLLVGLVLGLVLTLDSPFWPRIVVLSPAIAIVTALGLCLSLVSLWRLVTRASPRFELLLVVALVFLAWVGKQNWEWYFNGSTATYAEHRPWLGRLINQTPPGTGFCMVQGVVDFRDRTLEFFGKGYDLLQFPPEKALHNIDRCVAERRIWVLYPHHGEVLAELDRRWPHARREVHNHPDGLPGPTFWYPPADAASSAARDP
jgi:hypothetical protein